jgi:carbon-monoxide dehydrogenase small subunit
MMKTIHFILNDKPATAAVEPHHTVVELLRGLGLFGARESCGQGLCGCCTVRLDGATVSGCLQLAILVNGRAVTTIEHPDADGTIDPIQQAFIDAGTIQCGFCTPGFVLMTKELLVRNPRPDDEDIRAALSATCAGARPIPKSCAQ